MHVGVLELRVGLARRANPTAVVFTRLAAGQVLGVRPRQRQGTCPFLTLEKLGVRHTGRTGRFSEFGPQGLVSHNVGKQHAPKVLRIARWR